MLADHPLAERLERADAARSLEFVRAAALLYPETKATSLAVGGGHAIFAGSGSPLNKGIGLGISPLDGDPELDELERFYRSRRETPALELTPHAGGALLAAITRRGYSPRYSLAVLAATLAELHPDAPSADRIAIRRATPDDASLWSQTVASGFADDGNVAEDDLRLFMTQFHGTTSHCYLAEADGRIAGGAFMAVSGGVALLGATSVLPEFRRRGAHAALLRERLSHAAVLGCDLIMSSASPGSPSQRNLERHGLRVKYVKGVVSARS